MSQPELTWSIQFAPGTGNKLSYIEPYNTCTVTFSSNIPYKKFICRSTYGDDDWDRRTGILIQEYSNRQAGTNLTFTINALQHLLRNGKPQGGTYRIGMYAQNTTDGEWNLTAVFYINTNKEFYVLDSSGNKELNTIVNDDIT